MKKQRQFLRGICALLMVLCLVISLLPATAMAHSETVQWNDWEAEIGDSEYGYIFKLLDTPSLRSESFGLFGAEEPAVAEVPYTENTYIAESLDDIHSFASADQIEFIEPNYPVYLYEWTQIDATVSSNDAYYQDGSQWNLDMLQVPAMWEYGLEGQNLDGTDAITVAVVDSGIKYNHEDIHWDNVLLQEARSWVTTDQENVNDTFGHGTFVSGIIMATKGNEVGIAGIVPDIQLLPLRVFQGKTASTSDIISAVNYAVEKGADVINMSFGSEIHSAAFEAACQNAVLHDVILVAAAGNDGDNTASYPAQYDCVIGVGSVNAQGGRSSFSQKGRERVFVTAPGENLTSTYHESASSYTTGSGTSFSSPEVAALAAVAKSIDNDITQQKFADLLIATSADLGAVGRDDLYGYGLVDFQAAVESLLEIADQSAVSFAFLNETGEDIVLPSDMTLGVYPADRDGQPSGPEIAPDADGIYTVKTGEKADGKFIANRYCYQITGVDATRTYENTAGSFTAITDSRSVNVTLVSRTYYAAFTVTDTGGALIPSATIAVTRSSGDVISQITSGEHEGQFGVKTGNYKYEITAPGYYPLDGAFIINDADKSITAIMLSEADVASVAFQQVNSAAQVLTAGNSVSVFDSEGNQIEMYQGYYRLAPGAYHYEADSKNYYQETGGFVIEDTDKGQPKTVTITMERPTFWVHFEVMPLKAKVRLFDDKGEAMINRSAGEYHVPIGKYSYVVTCDGYQTVRENLMIAESSGTQGIVTIKITMIAKDSGDGDNGGGGGGGGSAAKEYTVRFDSNGGSAAASQTIAENGKAAEPVVPTKRDCEFIGWYTDSACTKAYDFNTKVTTDLTLYAGWRELGVAAKTFADVADDYWGKTAIEALANAGIINGYEDGTFKPGNGIIRVEFLTILMKALDPEETELSATRQFNDVKATDWFADTVLRAKALGIVTGDPSNRFHPNAEITREEIFTMTYRAMLKLGLLEASGKTTALQGFSDHGQISDYAMDAIGTLVERGLVNGAANLLTPKANATRAEAAQFLYNVRLYLQ